VHPLAEARVGVVHGYTTAFSVSALLLLLAAGAAGGLIRASRHDAAPEHGPAVPEPAMAG
jgi:hypothetical protein